MANPTQDTTSAGPDGAGGADARRRTIDRQRAEVRELRAAWRELYEGFARERNLAGQSYQFERRAVAAWRFAEAEGLGNDLAMLECEFGSGTAGIPEALAQVHVPLSRIERALAVVRDGLSRLPSLAYGVNLFKIGDEHHLVFHDFRRPAAAGEK